MVESNLEAGTVTIQNKRTRNSAWLPDDDEDRSLLTGPDDGADKFKWIVNKLNNDNYAVKNLETGQSAYVSPPPKKEKQVVAQSRYASMEWRIFGTGETDVYCIAPTNADYYWGVSSSVSGTPIELREGFTDPFNNWTIKSVTASSDSGAPTSQTSSTLNAQDSNDAPPLYVVVQAEYDRHPDRTACLESTRTETLETIDAWAFDQALPADLAAESAREQPNIFWLNGLAGTGKTTIAYTVAQQCHAKGVLGASFFCSRSIADCNDPLKIFPNIAYQLGLFYTPQGDRLAEIIKKDPSLLYSSVSRQLEELIVKPLASLRDNFPPCVVIIDALDECRVQRATFESEVLSALLKHEDDLFPLRFFVTSRPEAHIAASFDIPGHQNASRQLLLHEVALKQVTTDIRRFLEASLAVIKRRFRLVGPWPAEADLDTLSQLAEGVFIFAATAVKFIGDIEHSDPDERLEVLVSNSASYGSNSLLDDLYLQVLEAAFPKMSESLSTRLKSILGSIILVRDPLPPADLSHLIGLRTRTIRSSLSGLHSVLVVPESKDSTASIRIIHPTFAEFLLDSRRCANPLFVVDSRHQHTVLLRGCLNAMRELRRDICGIRDPSLLNIEVPDLHTHMAKAIPSYLRYACRHWSTHLSSGDLLDEVLNALLEFAEQWLLYWVEACSLLGILRDAISALNESQLRLASLDNDRARRVAALLHDCERLVIGFFPSISSSALQLYHSVLSFVPKETTLAKTYADQRRAETSVKVIHGVADSWDACLGTVIAHERDWVFAVDFSPDGGTVVSAGGDSKIRLWDALTCTLLLVLSGHTDWVWSAKYSPDGTRIVSAANDETVKIWDAVSGVLVRTLEGHQQGVGRAVFTPDGERIVSGSNDGDIKIWDAKAGTCLTTLAAHEASIDSVAVSLDGCWIASSPNEGPGQVYLWSLEAPYTRRILAAHGRDTKCSLVFSPSSSQLLMSSSRAEDLKSASGTSNDRISVQISIWDVSAGKCLRTLKPSGWPHTHIRSFAVSPVGDELACGLEDGAVVTADLSKGELRLILAGHTDPTSVAYNHDGTRIVSGSEDGTVRLWDVARGAKGVVPVKSTSTNSDSDLVSGITSLDCDSAVFSHDGSRLLCVCSDGTIVVERTDTWTRLYKPLSSPMIDHGFHYAAFSPDKAVIFARPAHGTIAELWDATTGSMRTNLPDCYDGMRASDIWHGVLGYMPHSFGGHSSSVMFSQDSQYLVTASDNGARLWSVATGQLIRQFAGHHRPVHSVAFSLDADRIATGSKDSSIIIWDANTGASLTICKGHCGPVYSAAFSPTGALVASGSSDHHVRLWKADTGELLQSFGGHSHAVSSVAFTPGGDVIISSSGDNTMRLWDVRTGDCLQVLHAKAWGGIIKLASDGTGIIIGGERVIQLWPPSEADPQAVTTLSWLPRRTWPAYYTEDGWAFLLTPAGRRRLCWVPADWQELRAHFSHTVVFKRRRTILGFAT